MYNKTAVNNRLPDPGRNDLRNDNPQPCCWHCRKPAPHRCRSEKNKPMKNHSLVAALLLCAMTPVAQSKEKPWSPSMPYNVDRRLDSGDPDPSPWTFSKDAQRAEYRMLYLLQAHKDAVLLALSMERKVKSREITQEQIIEPRSIDGNLVEVVKCSFSDVLPYFKAKSNPTLLLMMLYHFEVYCRGGDSDEGWPAIIKPLHEIDPEITAKAKELAKKGIAERNKIKP